MVHAGVTVLSEAVEGHVCWRVLLQWHGGVSEGVTAADWQPTVHHAWMTELVRLVDLRYKLGGLEHRRNQTLQEDTWHFQRRLLWNLWGYCMALSTPVRVCEETHFAEPSVPLAGRHA